MYIKATFERVFVCIFFTYSHNLYILWSWFATKNILRKKRRTQHKTHITHTQTHSNINKEIALTMDLTDNYESYPYVHNRGCTKLPLTWFPSHFFPHSNFASPPSPFIIPPFFPFPFPSYSLLFISLFSSLFLSLPFSHTWFSSPTAWFYSPQGGRAEATLYTPEMILKIIIKKGMIKTKLIFLCIVGHNSV